ncbi:DUF952 domain-containing protein [Paenibacillus allorhizosphaerae]|uniref:DUF952 domain-containing protein n=1 Tax=Paenibacillus allorhizosphaerae TaxID=2849866 RepID=UPI001C407A6B
MYHIVKIEDWKIARESGWYEPESIKKDGFIHCSDAGQVAGIVWCIINLCFSNGNGLHCQHPRTGFF